MGPALLMSQVSLGDAGPAPETSLRGEVLARRFAYCTLTVIFWDRMPAGLCSSWFMSPNTS